MSKVQEKTTTVRRRKQPKRKPTVSTRKVTGNRSAIAIDTETTGIDFYHGCRPFYVSTCDEDGNVLSWEWFVDPHTRTPIIPKEDIREIQRTLKDREWIFHNAKFDMRALETIGVVKPHRLADWDHVHDTHVASHILSSASKHGLKDLCLLHLDIPDDDEQALEVACNTARRYGRKHNWRIAKPGDPHFPAVKRFDKKNKGWKMDMWLPRAVAAVEEYDDDHQWWTVCSQYANRDAERTMLLWMMFREAMDEESLRDIYDVRRKLLGVTYDMERKGVTINKQRLDDAVKQYGDDAATARKKAIRLADGCIDNLNSPKQLQGTLYGHFKLKPVKETKTGYSTDKDTLDILELSVSERSKAYHFIKNLRSSRKRDKAVDYLDGYRLVSMPVDNEWLTIHPWFNISGTATTRQASYNPNAQNISKQEGFNLRSVFGPLVGREWWSIDYENIELRIFAYASGDKRLIEAFESGLSVHMVIAEELHPKEVKRLGVDGFKKTDKYRWTKNGNFALLYGASPAKADLTYHVDGAYDRIRKRFPSIDTFMAKMDQSARKKGCVYTLGGYRLEVPRGKPHVAVNYFVQGSAGWAMTKALERVGEYVDTLGDNYWINMVIHDELDFDFPRRKGNKPKVRKIKHLMERSGDDIGLPTPVDVELIRDTWANGVGISL